MPSTDTFEGVRQPSMPIEALKAHLFRLQQTTSGAEWSERLSERKKQEIEFYTKWRRRADEASLTKKEHAQSYGHRKYYAGTDLSTRYVESWMTSAATNKVFLDYGCGNGANTCKAARVARLAIGIDLSADALNNARDAARQAGLQEKCEFVRTDAENTGLPDGSVDAILCSGMLHHVDVTLAFPELNRILAPSGRIMCIEALGYNPIIQLCRALHPGNRTPGEKGHILTLAEVRLAATYFDVGDVRYWHMASVLAPYLRPMLSMLNAVDRVITNVPLLQLMSWMFTFELEKRVDEHS